MDWKSLLRLSTLFLLVVRDSPSVIGTTLLGNFVLTVAAVFGEAFFLLLAGAGERKIKKKKKSFCKVLYLRFAYLGLDCV